MPRRVRLRELDLDGIVADCQHGVRVAAIWARWNIPLSRLYRILDDHNVFRHQGVMARIPAELGREIVDDYRGGDPIRAIAERRGVSIGAVSELAYRWAASRGRQRDRATMIELSRWLVGTPFSDGEVDAIQRVGADTQARGPAALETIDAHIRGDVARRLVEIVTSRWLTDQR